MKGMPATTILALLSLPRFGRKTVRAIVLRFRDDPASPSPSDLPAILAAYATNQHVDRAGVDQALAEAADQLEAADRAGIRILTIFDDDFPTAVRDIPDPPILLFVKGSVKAVQGLPAVAVIGTREPTPYGEGAAHRLGKRFVERGFVVVSGLAKGCDAFAHQGCVDAGGVGVAVMAHGLDTVYPAENRSLAEKLVACGGCLVSEYPPGTKAHRGHFVERDRLQSGLARGVVVVETDIEGGTMHTVGFAKEQHRCLACVAHPPQFLGQAKVKGNQHLISTGDAVPLADAADLERFASALLSAEGCTRATSVNNVGGTRSDQNGQTSLW